MPSTGRAAGLSAVVAVLAVLALAVAVAATAALARDDATRTTATAAVRGVVTDEQAARLERAEQVLIRRCMARAGFRYWVVPGPADPVPFRYVLDDVAWAAKHGYGTALQRAADARMSADPNARYFRSLRPDRKSAAIAALNGANPNGLKATLPNGLVVRHSDQGCESEAQRTLYGDLRAWYASTKLTENLPGERYSQVVTDRRYQAALPDWAACMRTRGYRFSTPDDAHAVVADPANSPPHAAEVRQAVAEATCAASSGLGGLARRLDQTYEARLQDRYRDVLAERDAQQRRALPVAERLTATP